MLYRAPDGFLTGVGLEIDSVKPLFGLAESIAIRAPGDHVVFPYHTGDNVYDTFSSTRAGVGSLSYSGLLTGEVGVIDDLLKGIGVYAPVNTPPRLRLLAVNGTTPYWGWKLWDLRLSGLGLNSQALGNTLAIRGRLMFTFRKMETLPEFLA